MNADKEKNPQKDLNLRRSAKICGKGFCYPCGD
jgi:hypothetical protein